MGTQPQVWPRIHIEKRPKSVQKAGRRSSEGRGYLSGIEPLVGIVRAGQGF